MKKLIVLQQPIADMPQYDSITVRHIPEAHDLHDWPKQFKEMAVKHLTIETDTIIDHIAKCSTPVHSFERPSWELQQVINRLKHTFGVTYITE